MSELSEEIRIKVTPETLRDFDALCRAIESTKQDKGRALIELWVAKELHAHTLRSRLLRGHGIDAESDGSRQA